jgi:hypothetical protein
MANSWHGFTPGVAYQRDEVVATCERHIHSGCLSNAAEAELWLDEIRRCPHERLVWTPGESWRRSPMNPNAWRTEAGEPIWVRRVIPKVFKQ